MQLDDVFRLRCQRLDADCRCSASPPPAPCRPGRGSRVRDDRGPAGRGRTRRSMANAPPPGLVARLLARQELVERNRPVLGPDAARRTKIGNAAFGRDAGAGERQHHARLVHQRAQARRPRFRDRARASFRASCRAALHMHGQVSTNGVKSNTSQGAIMRYLHTMLRVRNLDAALDFYCNKLGLKEVRRHVDDKARYTLVFLAAPGDDELVAKRTAEPRRRRWSSSHTIGIARGLRRGALFRPSRLRGRRHLRDSAIG